MKEKKGILITGMPHSGTRLIVKMLGEHPEITVPKSYNSVEEPSVLHEFFIDVMNKSKLSSEKYDLEKEDLRMILESISKERNWVVKMPAYPLMCMKEFIYSMPNIRCVIYTSRPEKKIINSFMRKNENKILFEDEDEKIRQIKKLMKKYRKKHLHECIPKRIFEDQIKSCKERWNECKKILKENGITYLNIDVEKFAKEKSYVVEKMEKMNLSKTSIDDMINVVDYKRLIKNNNKKRIHKKVFEYVKSRAKSTLKI